MFLKYFLAMAIVGGTAWSLKQLCYLPYQCKVAEARIQNSTMMLFDVPDSFRRRAIVTANEDTIVHCLNINPTEINLYMLKAASDRILSRDDQAVGEYRSALVFDRRPEIYLQLGLVELQRGRRAEALSALTASVCFSPSLLDQISDPGVYQEVRSRLEQFEQTISRGTAPRLVLP